MNYFMFYIDHIANYMIFYGFPPRMSAYIDCILMIKVYKNIIISRLGECSQAPHITQAPCAKTTTRNPFAT